MPSAGISPEAVPRKGGKKKGNRVNRDTDGFVERGKELENEGSLALLTLGNQDGQKRSTSKTRSLTVSTG